jgi:hypothetical protein
MSSVHRQSDAKDPISDFAPHGVCGVGATARWPLDRKVPGIRSGLAVEPHPANLQGRKPRWGENAARRPWGRFFSGLKGVPSEGTLEFQFSHYREDGLRPNIREVFCVL